MKKSDMLDYIIQLLAREGVEKTWNMTQEELANEILSTLEGAGMKPPHHPDRYNDDYLEGGNWSDDVYEWESESEEK